MNVVTVSYSEIRSWRDCQLQHWLAYRQRQPGRGGPAARLGTWWHSMQQEWYKGRQAGVPTSQLAYEVPTKWLSGQPESQEQQDQISTLLWMWDGFLEAGDPFAAWQVVGAEIELSCALPRVPGQPDDLLFMMRGFLDLVVSQGRHFRIVDHKTQAKLVSPEATNQDMDMDDQLGLYLWLARQCLGAEPRRTAATWNYAITTNLKKKDRELTERFWRVHSARTPKALDRIAYEAGQAALQAYTNPLVVEPPRSPDKEKCRWRCDFREECYYARSQDRPIRLELSSKPDQLPGGIVAL